MRKTNDPQAPLSLDNQIDEERVRRALGLTGSAPHQQRPEQARQRHRFVADGAVPVVMLNRADGETSGLKEKLTAAETRLEQERARHIETKRQLVEAQAAQQAAETRRMHAELAHREALTAEVTARKAAEDALATLRAESTISAPVPAVEPPARPRAERVTRKPRMPITAKEQKPVRWWTPSYRAKTR